MYRGTMTAAMGAMRVLMIQNDRSALRRQVPRASP